MTTTTTDFLTQHDGLSRGQAGRDAVSAARGGTYDGVICLGGVDWWYHNRGHYDLQMMREFSRRMPVVYVNSIGMRMPKLGEGAMFFRRIIRKLRSIRRGMVEARPNFHVFSPFTLPGRRCRSINRVLLPRLVKWAARRAGIRRPLLWVACPPGAALVDAIDPVAVVYQRTDRYECFRGVDPELIRADDRRLKDIAATVLYCSRALHEVERDTCPHTVYADHGVDFDRFEAAGRSSNGPADVRELPRPRVGFVGGIDAHTFAPDLFLDVARAMPDVQFVLVGACSLDDGWCDLPNVHQLGQRPYDDVAHYMAACDVLIMPWNRSEWIRACNPVKLKEYLATGRPVVTTWFDELEQYRHLVSVADDADGFVSAIRRALDRPGDAESRRAFVREHTWSAKAELVEHQLTALGIKANASPPEHASS